MFILLALIDLILRVPLVAHLFSCASPAICLTLLPFFTFSSLFSPELSRNSPDGVSVGLGEDDNIFEWELMIVGPPDTFYEEGLFKATLKFPADFPNSPPKMIFTTEICHPNVYENGEVCISILHPPGEDAHNPQELAIERWRPILGVEAVIVSVISMLCDPNIESPAHLDNAKLFRDDLPGFKKKCRQCVRKSQEDF